MHCIAPIGKLSNENKESVRLISDMYAYSVFFLPLYFSSLLPPYYPFSFLKCFLFTCTHGHGHWSQMQYQYSFMFSQCRYFFLKNAEKRKIVMWFKCVHVCAIIYSDNICILVLIYYLSSFNIF